MRAALKAAFTAGQEDKPVSDYTPTTEDIKQRYWASRYGTDAVIRVIPQAKSMFSSEFDRWLAAHDAEVLAAAGVTQSESVER